MSKNFRFLQKAMEMLMHVFLPRRPCCFS